MLRQVACLVAQAGWGIDNYAAGENTSIYSLVVASFFPTGYHLGLMSEHNNRQSLTALALETSGRLGSVALGREGNLMAEREFSADRRHAGQLVPAVAGICAQNGVLPVEIDCIFVSVGPGSFTGLRIAVSVAKALSFCLDCRIVAVPSMDALVLNVDDCEGVDRILCVRDAQKRHVYGAIYERGSGVCIPGWQQKLEAQRIKPAEVLEQAGAGISVLGEGLGVPFRGFSGGGCQYSG